MAPIKFEDNLKETLEKRRLQPSKDAWSKLENRLDENTSQKSKNKFWFWGIAASIVGILLVSTLFLNNEVEPIEENTVVDVEIKESSPTEIEDSNQVEKTPVEVKKEELIEIPSTQVASKEAVPHKPKQALEVQPQSNTEITVVEPKEKVEENSFEIFEDFKVNEVVAQVQELVNKNQTVTESEIDSLLKVAQQEMQKQRIYNEETGTVDALALLQEVETDLDKSFRDKVFEALVSNIENAATAIVQRNE